MAVAVSPKIQLSYEPLDLTTRHPFGISYGSSSVTENVLVSLRWGELTGLGEAAPVSYHGESRSTACAILADLASCELLGCDPFGVAAIMARLDRHIAGHNSVKAALEMALWDLCGQVLAQPVYRLFGLAGMKTPMTDFTIGIDSLDVVETKTREAVEAGYRMLKVKQGTAYDREIIERVRKVAPDLPLRVDANGAWTPKRAVEMSAFLREHNVEFIEQPLPKLAQVADWRFVKERSCLPIFADESCCRAQDVARLSGSVDGVVVKLAKTGGLGEALKVIHTARSHDLRIMIGCMIESSIGVTAAAHLAPLADYLDLDGALLLARDPFAGARYSDGFMLLNDSPGLGVHKRP